jgi:nicotinamide-nucleotide amidase
MTTELKLAQLSRSVGRYLLERGLTLATAESCTGGWVAKALTDVAGSSQWFAEGWVTYSNAAKQARLGVPSNVLLRQGAVSEATVMAMARGALQRGGVDVALAVSGIAGPGGSVPGKPVGTVWFAWAERVGRIVRVRTLRKRFQGDREAVRLSAAIAALEGVVRAPRKLKVTRGLAARRT